LDFAERRVLYKPHLDHIISIYKWWPHSIYNVQWLCGKCNLSKWYK
jgi:5-methylcytosine-specific restriction endonuclease McrA